MRQKPVENLTMYIIDRFQIHQQMRHQFAFLRNLPTFPLLCRSASPLPNSIKANDVGKSSSPPPVSNPPHLQLGFQRWDVLSLVGFFLRWGGGVGGRTPELSRVEQEASRGEGEGGVHPHPPGLLGRVD